MLDLVIRNALLFDGTGCAPQTLSVGIRDGRIEVVAFRIEQPASREIDATGLWLTPGFIDIHTHYDLEVEVNPGLAESVRHGVTTVLMGNCSLSVACGDPADLANIFQRVETLPAELVERWLPQGKSWPTFRAYLEHLEHLPLGPNVAALLGHSALRVRVMGLERSVQGPAGSEEVAQMRRLAAEGIDAGFCGLSVDMVHWHKVSGVWAGRALPSHHADYDEYAALAEVCRERDAVFQVTPNPERSTSLWHILRLGAASPRRPPLRMTLLSALDLDTQPWLWRVYAPFLWVYNRLGGNNLRMQTLTEPFVIYSGGPITPLFEEFASGVELNNLRDASRRRALWRVPGFRERFEADWLRPGIKTFHRDFSRILIASVPGHDWAGKTIAEVASISHQRPIDVFMDLLESADEEFVWVASGANNRPGIRQKLMSLPYVLPGFTDAGAHCRNLAYYDGALSILRQAVQSGFMSPERAVQRVTGEPASWLNLDVGTIAPGRRADIVLIDPGALTRARPAPVCVKDPALGGAQRMVNRDPTSPIQAVFVGGTQLVGEGQPLPTLGRTKTGRLLARRSPLTGIDAVRQRYRNRIDDLHFDHGLTAYWDIFVMKHRVWPNVCLHVFAVFLMYGSGILAAISHNGWWLVGIFVSNAVGQYGHARFEPTHIDRRDAVFSWRAMFALTRLTGLVICGRYRSEIHRVESLLRL